VEKRLIVLTGAALNALPLFDQGESKAAQQMLAASTN